MITKQAIRKGVTVQCNGIILTKEEIITKGENWSEHSETFFRKMLKQGGTFSLKGDQFYIETPDLLLNNKGELEPTLKEDEDEE